eukprot:scaffold20818_cov112-Isochrysis_galbana.AAC.6
MGCAEVLWGVIHRPTSVSRCPLRKALHASGDSAGHPLSIAVRSLRWPFECNELLWDQFGPPKRIVVDSRSCGSKGGGCNTQKSLCSTLFPCQERQALAIGPGSASSASQCARPSQEVPQALAQARNHTCIELFSALEGRTRLEPGSRFMSTSIGGCVLRELSGRHRSNKQPRARNFS